MLHTSCCTQSEAILSNCVSLKNLNMQSLKNHVCILPTRCSYAPHVVGRNTCRPRVAIVQKASGTLGSTSLFGGDTNSLIGGGPVSEGVAATKPKLNDVALESELGMDYSNLLKALQDSDFRAADDETRALLIKLAGPGAVQRGWVYFSEIKTIPNKDLQTMDNLWKTASNGRFGYSVQREIFTQSQKRWAKFFKTIDWTQGEYNIYRKWPLEFKYSIDAPRGHLPLTNALRGTQLFQALLEHPAFEKQSKAKGIDETTREQNKSTNKLF